MPLLRSYYLISQVEHALALVTASKTGLTDSEMLDLLAHDAAFHSEATYGEVQIFINFKVCKSVHHHTFQINQPTRCNSFSSLLLDVYVQLNMFRRSSRPSSGAQQLQ